MTARARLTACLICLATMAFSVQDGTAQTNTAEIEGTVHDALGGAVPGASVTITQRITGSARERVSDSAGRFLFSELPVGEYVLSVELSGFKRTTEAGIRLNVGQRLTIPIVLQVGGISDAITVTAAVGLLNTVNAERGDVIDNRQVVQLPLNGRQFLQLAQLTDGIVIPPGGTRGAARLGRTSL